MTRQKRGRGKRGDETEEDSNRKGENKSEWMRKKTPHSDAVMSSIL